MGIFNEGAKSAWIKNIVYGALWNISIIVGFYFFVILIGQMLNGIYLGSFVEPLGTREGFLVVSAVPLLIRAVYATWYKATNSSIHTYLANGGIFLGSYALYLLLTLIPWLLFIAWFQSQIGSAL